MAPLLASGRCEARGELAADPGIEREAARAEDHHKQKGCQEDERKFARGERLAVVDHQEGDEHIQHNGDQGQACEESQDHKARAEELGEDAEHERKTASNSQRVGEVDLELFEVDPLVEAVDEQQDSEEEA